MSDSDNDVTLVDRTVTICVLGNYMMFAAAVASEEGVTALYVALLLLAAACLGFSLSGPILRYVVARWMLRANSNTMDFAYRIAPLLLHGVAVCVVWMIGQAVVFRPAAGL